MKKVYLVWLMCIGASFLYSSTLNTDSVTDYLSEEDCLRFDTLFAFSEESELINPDSVRKAIRYRQQLQASIDFSYETKYYIESNPTISNGMGRILVICDTATYNALTFKNIIIQIFYLIYQVQCLLEMLQSNIFM